MHFTVVSPVKQTCCILMVKIKLQCPWLDLTFDLTFIKIFLGENNDNEQQAICIFVIQQNT